MPICAVLVALKDQLSRLPPAFEKEFYSIAKTKLKVFYLEGME